MSARGAAAESFADFVVQGKAQDALAGGLACGTARLDRHRRLRRRGHEVATPAQPSQDVLARTLQNWTALDRRGSSSSSSTRPGR